MYNVGDKVRVIGNGTGCFKGREGTVIPYHGKPLHPFDTFVMVKGWTTGHWFDSVTELEPEGRQDYPGDKTGAQGGVQGSQRASLRGGGEDTSNSAEGMANNQV